MHSNLKIRLVGISIFIISLVLYTLTLEPTTSFWDCSEFILSASNLEVNHPAGAPLFMLIGRLFSLFSFGNEEHIAKTINFMSGFFSALTVFFLFHIIIKLTQKITNQPLTIIGCATIGALTFAVSDSFWFSAVEGEVYGLSMFFLTLTFWAALKWEEGFSTAGNAKWVLFLALITGLGIGVHLLNLLVLPTIIMIMGFRKHHYSTFKMLLFFGIGLVTLLSILHILTPVTMKTLAWLDYAFVNQLHFPVHSGALFGVALISSIFIFSIYYSHKRRKTIAEYATISVFLFLIGFSVYSVNIIRSSANPPVNFGRPDNIYSLINYLNREQYPKRPLLYGQAYNSPITDVEKRYSKDYFDGEYRSTELSPTYEYDKNTCSLFPRMYSTEKNHIKIYKSWINIKGKRVKVKDSSGKSKAIVVPTLGDNLKFFVNYQLGYMFGRYFMWNFVGRQNDRQGYHNITNGNWLSGIRFIDNIRLGNQDKFPDWLKENKARNTYFFLPLILGLIGAFYHYKKHVSGFYAILALFIMGGLGLTIYLNEIPITPRERDYAFVVAFLAFAIWIGIGCAALSEVLKRYLKNPKFNPYLLILLFTAVPGLMLLNNYDDHNRSGRTVARDLAENILKSCPKDAILFTSGDNDTYPLLYCQEVEKIRKDVRIVIMPFVATNWFVDGLRKDKYNDKGLNMTIAQRNYELGRFDYVPVLDKVKRDSSWKEIFNFIQSNKSGTKVRLNSGEEKSYIPTTSLSFPIKVGNTTGVIPVSLKGKNVVYQHQLAFWDIVSSNATQRPICFVSYGEAHKQGLSDYVQCEGFVYRIVPRNLTTSNSNTEMLYSKLLNDYKWGNISNPKVYADWNTIINVKNFQVRSVFNTIAEQLIKEGKKDKAAILLNHCKEQIPLSQIPYDLSCFRQAELMQMAGIKEDTMIYITELEQQVVQTLNYYDSLNSKQQIKLKNEIQNEMAYLNLLKNTASKLDQDKAQELRLLINKYYQSMMSS